ncbi:unnamed protein product [Pseudo-nitzschia multistriata]|uniref:Uncharacterized protein n=1 Tax=Pseudo-nitzschia multistriata TaxID=183589 RepID=A0A448Z5X2_9STRA|nr:unnamed protein product [Pseudo-nitzschia multistriata]
MAPPDTLEALGHLQDYADASEKAHDELKSCLWQLTKSRRNVRSGILGVDSANAYTAGLLREELRAQFRVFDAAARGDNDGIADLVNEEEGAAPAKDSGAASARSSAPEWKLCNVRLERKKPKTDDEQSLDPNPSSSWMVVEEEDLTDGDDERRNEDLDEEERILQTDPLKLFGGYFTARELKVAQRNAQRALDGYIQAASDAARLLAMLPAEK